MRRRNIITLTAGAAATLALPARAQQPVKTYHLAILTHFDRVDHATGKQERYWTAFFDELRRFGYVEDRNLTVTWLSSQVDADRAAELVRGVADHKPDAIFTPDARMAFFLGRMAGEIPAVAITVDPVGSGVAASLARPGGNVTGFSIDAGLELIGKRVDLFKEAVPTASRMAWLTPRRTMDLPIGKVTRVGVRTAGMTLIDAVLEAPIDEAAYRRAFAAIARDSVDSLWVATVGENLQYRRLIAELSIGAKLASMFGWRENVEAGGLMSYGNDVGDTFRRSATYIDRILKGAKPGELPFQQPTKFELVINLKAARVLGLTIPPTFLARADEVIE
jgi:putative tryptophan/tyrosine transport system substrate-binding protein